MSFLGNAREPGGGLRCAVEGCLMRPAASGKCINHDPDRRAVIQAARKRGAEARKAQRAQAADAATQPPSSAPTGALKLETAEEIHACLAETINAVRLGTMTPTAGNVVGSLCRAALTALEVKLAEQLEAQLAPTNGAHPMAEKKPEVSTFTPRTKEEIETALRERKALASMLVPPKQPAGQATAGASPVTYAEAPRPAVPPAPAVDVRPVELAKQEKLALIDAKVLEIRKATVELAEQEKNAAALIAQMKTERQALAAQKEKLERDVIEIQQSLAAAEAQQLAEQAARDQLARGESERIPLKQWREKFREAILPIITRVVSGLVKLRALLKEKGATLETVAGLRSQPGLDNETRSEFIAVSVSAGQTLKDLHDRIREHERALAEAESFVPDPRTPDGKTAINGLRYTLESVSGIVTHKLVDISNPRVVPPSAGIEGETPSSVELAERIASVLTQYGAVQKRANRVARPQPPLVFEIIPKESKPRHETMAELRGPKPEQTRAAGVPEEN